MVERSSLTLRRTIIRLNFDIYVSEFEAGVGI